MLMRKVWIVDDEELLCEICAETLQGHYETETFKTPETVLKALDQGWCPDVFVSDIRMPQMSGMALIAELRRRKLEKPVLMMSAFADKENAIQALSLGVFALLEKPFRPAQLLHSVHRASAYGELLEMTEGLLGTYQALLGSMSSLLGLCRDRYVQAENQVGATPVSERDLNKIKAYLAAILEESRLEEATERTGREIAHVLSRREKLKAILVGSET
ncbi:MAG: hypothetical protein A2X94_11505 [Bdellovibrionales bacterium GWB1_55_8]|nr:MAG: hypothetical protein A2X94_11505 [Bdellovibrionales bacterium GWB1_55_8]